MNSRIPVSIFGATGQVGRHIATRLAMHPRFCIGQFIGSPASVGRDYQSVWQEKESALSAHYGTWYPAFPYPDTIPSHPILGISDIPDGAIVLSSIPERAGPDEDALANRGCTIISNSPYRRLDPAVTLAIPGIPYPTDSYIKIPNCATIGLALALYPIAGLLDAIPLSISTYQSLSGRGDAKYPQELAIGNVFPLRNSPEDTEARISGELHRLIPNLTVSVSCYRTPTPVGHLIDVALVHKGKLTIPQLEDLWHSHIHAGNACTIRLTNDRLHPQSQPDATVDNGMSISIGNLVDHYDSGIIRMTIVVNNLVRGAAGSLIMALEQWAADK